jgi:hypothetical protein
MIPVTWYAIAALVISNLVTAAMWRSAAHDMQLVEARSEVAAEISKRVIAEQKQITEDTTNAWKSALDVTRADWAKRLRLANVQPMPGISGPAGGADGLPADALAIAAQCAETTLMLRSLQDWAEKQGRVQ